MSKIRLTKKRLRLLHVAMSLDDVLFEKFRRLNEQLGKERLALLKSKQVISVRQRRGKILYALQIEDILVSPEGTMVIVK